MNHIIRKWALSLAVSIALAVSAKAAVLISSSTDNGNLDQDTLANYNPSLGVYNTSGSVTGWSSDGNSNGDGFANVGTSLAQSGSNVFFAQQGTWFFDSASNLNYTVHTGDVFTLTLYASYRGTGPASNATVDPDLFINGYDNMTPVTSDQLTLGSGYQLETFTYTAQPSDNGSPLVAPYIVVTVPSNSNANFVTADTVTLSVTPVPEPSSWAMLALACGAAGIIYGPRRKEHPGW